MPQIGQGSALFDDTPVNGQLEKGITSNWAYDHAHDPDGHGNDLYPWTIFIQTFTTPKSHTNWNSNNISGYQLFYGSKISSGAQNDQITWDIVLAAGTWTIELLHVQAADTGQYSVQLDSVEKGVVEGYASDFTYNALSTITGITIPLTKKIEIKLKMATKHNSSSGYYGRITAIALKRTA